MDSKPGHSKLGAVPKAASSGKKKRKSSQKGTSQPPEYLQHDSVQYEYYTRTMSKGFQTDCEELLAAFAKLKNTSLKGFTNYWEGTALRSAFMGGVRFLTDELPYLAGTFFHVIRKFLKYSTNIYVKVGALFLLHAVYCAQKDNNERVQIRLTHPEVKNILEMARSLKRKGEDALIVFYKLASEEAFKFVAIEEPLGLDPHFAWQEKQLENDIFKDTEKPKETLDSLTRHCDSLIASSKAYDKALKAYEEKIGETIRVPRPEGNAAEQIAAQLKAIQEEFNRIQALDSD